MRTADFDFQLPAEFIAQQPAEPRDSSRLMVLRRSSGTIEHSIFRDLPELLRRGDLLVVNDTRVMAARLVGRRADTGGAAEALLIRPFSDTRWETLFRPARAALPGRVFRFATAEGEIPATVVHREADSVVLEFSRSFDPATAGSVPLPPYIKEYSGDPERYQTVYARAARSAAAPTAGLHFTPELLHRLSLAGVERTSLTLEVGPGTFKPVTVEDPREHQLHAEHITLPPPDAAAIAPAKDSGRRIVAVGTTVVRTLEHVARERGQIEAYEGWTSLRILPGDEFRVIDVLITNFHLPRSTLLMLVCAFAGTELVLRAYEEAVRERYRFYSFGDAMLILP
jgi:S-adenosylmethionine:tRNA ribosyltransferase-isomerase